MDTINHDVLLRKRGHYGIQGIALNWFQSYLSKRKQFVSIIAYSSSTCKILLVALQGSVLDPLLFHIYTDDLPYSCKHVSFYLFANDTNSYFESNDFSNLTRLVNKELTKVKCWLDCNKHAGNIDKMNIFYFHSTRKKIPDSINLGIGKDIIKRTKYVKFFIILVDEHLPWKFHIHKSCKKLSRT